MKIIITEQQYKKFLGKLKRKINNFFDSDNSCSTSFINSQTWNKLYTDLVSNNLIKQGELLLIVWGAYAKVIRNG